MILQPWSAKTLSTCRIVLQGGTRLLGAEQQHTQALESGGCPRFCRHRTCGSCRRANARTRVGRAMETKVWPKLVGALAIDPKQPGLPQRLQGRP
jgi:hypothetical protein